MNLLVGRNRARRRLVLTFSASMMVLAVALHGVSAFADDESGPADGCAPSLVSEGFFPRFADTYRICCLTTSRIPLTFLPTGLMKASRFRLRATSRPHTVARRRRLTSRRSHIRLSPLAQPKRSVTRAVITQATQVL